MNHLLLRGFWISLLLHGIVFSLIFTVGSLLPDATQTLIIDFALEKDCGDCPSCNCPEKPAPLEKLLHKEQKKTASNPPIQEVPPLQKPVPQPPEKVDGVLRKEEPTREVEKVEEQIVQNIAAVRSKKKFVVKEKTTQPKVEPYEQLETEKTTNNVVESFPEKAQDPLSEETTEASEIVSSSKLPIQPSDTPALKKEQYLHINFSSIHKRVENNISYPRIARKMGWQGKVVVAFTLCADGSVKDIRITRSCGFKALDANAIKTIQRSAPFPTPPSELELSLPITYRLQ